MAISGFMWECDCGRVDYGEYPPQECSKCNGIDSFLKVPEDLIEEREAKAVLSAQGEDDED